MSSSQPMINSFFKQINTQILRFYVVGFATSGCCWVLYEMLYLLNSHAEYREAMSWAISYGVTSVLAHYLHYRITFEPNRSYLTSLWRTMFVYLTSMVLSTITDHMLIEWGLHHRMAWILNMGGFGIINFFFLKWYAYKSKTQIQTTT